MNPVNKIQAHNALKRSRSLFLFAVSLSLCMCFIYAAVIYHDKREADLKYCAAIDRERKIKSLSGFLGRIEAEIEFLTRRSRNFPSQEKEYLNKHIISIFSVLLNDEQSEPFYSVYERTADGGYAFAYGGGSLDFSFPPGQLYDGELPKMFVIENLRLEGDDGISCIVFRKIDGDRYMLAAGIKSSSDIFYSGAVTEFHALFLESVSFAALMFIFLVIIIYSAAEVYRKRTAVLLDEAFRSAVKKHEQLRHDALKFAKERIDAGVVLRKLEAEKKALEHIIQERITDLREIGEHLRRENEKMSGVNRELRHARKRAIEASMVKTEFLANMSHEVRTPIHGILSYSSFGFKKFEHAKDIRQKYYFDKITVSADRLLMFISDLVDLSDLESGRILYKMTECSLTEILLTAAGGLERFSGEKNIFIGVPVSDVKIEGDFVRLKQVFQNIYSNALKFSPVDGVIRTEINIEDGYVKVSITDSGTGVDESEKQLIFEKFTQSARTKTGAGGIGLGLAICREIVSGHGGKIYAADNPEGTGSRFVVELPLPVTCN